MPLRRDACVLAIAIVSVACAWLQSRHGGPPIVSDSESYLAPARNLAAGRGFVAVQPVTYIHSQIPGYAVTFGPDVIRTPGYPAFLAIFLAAGLPLRAIVVTQQLTHVALAVAMFLYLDVTTRSRPMALLAALLLGSFPPALETANVLYSETVATVTLAAAIAAAERALHHASVVLAIVSGLLSGATVLIRPQMVWLAIPLAIVMLARKRIVLALFFLIAAEALPVAWMLRNERATGVATVSAVNDENVLFWWGAAVRAGERGTHWERLKAAMEQIGYRPQIARARLPLFREAMDLARAEGVVPERLDYAHRAIYMRRLAVRIIAGQPLAFVELMIGGAVALYLDLMAPLVLAVIMAIFFLAGVPWLWKRNRDLAALSAVTLAVLTVTSCTPGAGIRFVVPIAPFYLTGVAAGVMACWQWRAPAAAAAPVPRR